MEKYMLKILVLQHCFNVVLVFLMASFFLMNYLNFCASKVVFFDGRNKWCSCEEKEVAEEHIFLSLF